MLKKMGVRDVKALRGGYSDWVNSGRPVVFGLGAPQER